MPQSQVGMLKTCHNHKVSYWNLPQTQAVMLKTCHNDKVSYWNFPQTQAVMLKLATMTSRHVKTCHNSKVLYKNLPNSQVVMLKLVIITSNVKTFHTVTKKEPKLQKHPNYGNLHCHQSHPHSKTLRAITWPSKINLFTTFSAKLTNFNLNG